MTGKEKLETSQLDESEQKRMHFASVKPPQISRDPISTSVTAQRMPCDAKPLATHAPMPFEPPVMTAISFSQSHPLLSFLHCHLFSAQRFRTELKSTMAHDVRAHLRYQIRATLSASEIGRALSSFRCVIEARCSAMDAAITVENLIMVMWDRGGSVD